MACTDVDLYDSVLHCAGAKILPGVREKAYYIKKSNIVTWPTLPAIAGTATFANLASYTGNFTLASAQTSNVQCTSQGEAPSKSFNNVASLVVPGTEEEVSALARLLNNDDVVVLVPQRNGKYRVIGNTAYHTNVAVTQTTGAASTDAATTTLEVSVTDECPAPFYPGNIVTDDGTISGADDTPSA